MLSWLSSRQNFEALHKAVSLESFFTFLVVERVVGVEPVALGIDVQVCDLCVFRRLDEKLLLWNKGRDQFDFVFIQMELSPVQFPVHVRVGEEYLRCTALDDDVEYV